jgi:hypothetical protein
MIRSVWASERSRIVGMPRLRMIESPGREYSEGKTGGVPAANRRASSAHAVCGANVSGSADAIQPDAAGSSADQLGPHVQERAPYEPHSHLCALPSRKSTSSAATSIGTMPTDW